MHTFLMIVHILASVVLIGVVLLQSGKAGDLASAFGGSGSQTAFGARGAATLLTKATTVCAVVFMITSLGLAILLRRGSRGTVMEQLPEEATSQQGVQQSPQTAPPPAPQATDERSPSAGEGESP